MAYYPTSGKQTIHNIAYDFLKRIFDRQKSPNRFAGSADLNNLWEARSSQGTGEGGLNAPSLRALA
ncbi:hypothetical protein [Neoaquamicrobium sediminum]|uniref:hypothetical protein n=1 Tax=Neoaquamicrobium sediminum TaxID=1849104 RepID=UPI0015641D14|nr:hypothetical protein [Mesorhizobium sediminum]NRC57237.1 hypothetical protein [Mesorhizobium sediminum]